MVDNSKCFRSIENNIRRDYPEFCVTAKMRCKIELIFQGGSGVGCARLVYNITPTGAEVKGRPYSFIEASPSARPLTFEPGC